MQKSAPSECISPSSCCTEQPSPCSPWSVQQMMAFGQTKHRHLGRFSQSFLSADILRLTKRKENQRIGILRTAAPQNTCRFDSTASRIEWRASQLAVYMKQRFTASHIRMYSKSTLGLFSVSGNNRRGACVFTPTNLSAVLCGFIPRWPFTWEHSALLFCVSLRCEPC